MSGFRGNRTPKSFARMRKQIIEESPPADLGPLESEIAALESTLTTIDATLSDYGSRIEDLETP